MTTRFIRAQKSIPIPSDHPNSNVRFQVSILKSLTSYVRRKEPSPNDLGSLLRFNCFLACEDGIFCLAFGKGFQGAGKPGVRRVIRIFRNFPIGFRVVFLTSHKEI